MRLLIDLQGCQNGSRHRGIGRYSLSLVKALLRNAGRHDIFILLNGLFADTVEPLRQEFRGLIAPERVIVMALPGPVDELKPENAWRRHAALLLRESLIADLAPDALLVTSMVEGAMDDTVTSVGWLPGPTIIASVLYDLIPLIDPERYIGWAPLRKWYMDKMASMRRCDLLLAISASAKQEAEQYLGVEAARVYNISTAADDLFVEAQVDEEKAISCRARMGIVRPYLMHSGNVEPRKNFQGLIRAFASLAPQLRQRHQLVLVGKFSTEARRDLQAVTAEAGLKAGEVVLTGHVSDDELVLLYSGCRLFVFPSLHEGFGLPALEAMHFGVPTIGSNTTSVPEVIGRADATFDPTSVPAMAGLITRVLTDAPFREELARHARTHAARFTWDASAQQAIAALEARLDEAPRRPLHSPHARRRLLVHQLAAIHQTPPPDESELLAVANCLVANERAVMHLRAHASFGGALTWRIEGPFDSSYSLALVNRECARALDELGHQVALHSTEGPGDFPANPAFLADNPDLARLHARVQTHPPSRCDVVSRNLYPPRVADMSAPLNALHPYAWEETGFPAAWVDAFNTHLQGLTCLSTHVQRVLLNNGVRVPMATAGCGVDHWERIEPTRGRHWPGKRFRFLHVSSCFPRKGADVMLEAFGDAFTSSDDVTLLVKTFPNPHNTIHEQLGACRAARARYPDVQILEDDLSDADLKALYVHCHVLVAPSRAEGFGLPLAEAMLSGLPVITTAWGGQMDFCNEQNAWLVDYRFTSTQTHFGLAGSVWADPDRASLAEAMKRAHAASPRDRSARAEHGRNVLLEHYRWRDVAARGLAAVRTWPAEAGRATPRTGWITTWNTKCGIASYSRHLIEASGQPVQVLAPHQDGRLRDDEAFVHRCWMANKLDNRFDELAGTIDALGLQAVVLQFNYGFYHLSAFAQFVHEQIDAGRVLIVTMHATGDPPELAHGDENWRLSTAAAALARCHRVLVHSVADMNRLKGLGVVDNVVLFPHPLWHLPPAEVVTLPAKGKGPLVATFGYCLPHKGLPEVLQAVAALHRRGEAVRLLMLNAEYPDPVSTDMVATLRRRIEQLGLRGIVDFRSEFLPDAEAAALLGHADLLVFAYQDTQESASGAIRHALATTRPVLVTPVPIFDELGGGVFRAADRGPEALATAISGAVDAIRLGNEEAKTVAAAAARWREAHDVERLARRLDAIAYSLHRLQPEPAVYRFAGSSPVLRTQVGKAVGLELHTTDQDGLLLFGPYLPLGAGSHIARVHLRARWSWGARAALHVVCAGATIRLAQIDLVGGADGEQHVELPFQLERACQDLEVQIHVNAALQAQVLSLEICRALVTPIHLGPGIDAAGRTD